MKLKLVLAILIVGVIWWFYMSPPDYLTPQGVILISEDARMEAEKVGHSARFEQALEVLDSVVPGHDDIVFLEDQNRAIVSAMDGKIWVYDLNANTAEVLVDPPLMAAGLHESPNSHHEIYFCSSYLWGEHYASDEQVGLYRLDLSDNSVSPVVLQVPATQISGPIVWGLHDADAPKLDRNGEGWEVRPLAFCNDLEISDDGQRIYFSEPFSYAGASMGGGTIKEVLAFQGNGRIWQHDLKSGETRLVVEGFHFLDGLLLETKEGAAQEHSLLASLTPGFRIMRFDLDGVDTGAAHIVQDGLPGMCDGMDRDAQGNIWCGLFAMRSPAITWLHKHPLVKEILLRLPVSTLEQPKNTGVLALSPDASQILYFAEYDGQRASNFASAIPYQDGYIYVTPFSRSHRGLVRFKNPLR